MIRRRLVAVALSLMTTAHTCSGFIPAAAAAAAVSRIPRPVFRSPGANSNGRHVGACSPPTDRNRPPRTLKNGAADSSDDIDLSSAMANARANLAAGTSPGAGLESAFDQADAAFADLIVTSVDDQGVTLDDEEVQELAQSGMMDQDSTSKKSKGLFSDMKDVFGALSGGAHIVKRDDGTL
ncbi:unnamed protein product [Ectocarpus sp. 6 AP-2014]